MNLYPMFANLVGRPVLVVGGGAVAARKVAGLLEAGAEVRVGAPHLHRQLAALCRAGQITHLEACFDPAWLHEVWLVIAATGDAAVNAAVARAASERRVLLNVVDDAALSHFHVPARLRRGALTLAISSAGVAPALARRLRAQLEVLVDNSLGALAEMVTHLRPRIRQVFPDLVARTHFYDDLVDGPVGTALRRGQTRRARQLLLQQLRSGAQRARGSVALVGAGPGDPDLLTVAALRALQRADVVVHDRLVGTEVLQRARRDAVLIDVGKRVGEDHEATQQRIHRLLCAHAKAGRRVVRLKGGDPLVFARGGEELAWLERHGIACEVIPGITAAVACAARAGVPLTQRGLSASLLLRTLRGADRVAADEWRQLARARQTLALYMGVSQVAQVATKLMQHGRAADTPFVLVENGTCADERVFSGRLDQLAAQVRRHRVQAPAMLIIGEVAALARPRRLPRTAASHEQELKPAA